MSSTPMSLAFKKRLKQLDQQATSSTSSRPKVKRKNLLHGCKLCPDRNFFVSTKSKTRPANSSVQGHVEKEHHGINYLTLTKKWGYRVHYEDGTVENIPILESDIGEKEETVVEADSLVDITSNFSGGLRPALEHRYEDTFQGLGSQLQEFLSTRTGQNNGSDNSQAGSSLGQVLHTNEFQESSAGSVFPDLPILSLGFDPQSGTGNVLGLQSSADPACTDNLNYAFDEGRIDSPGSHNVDTTFTMSSQIPIDPSLTSQEELIDDTLSADSEQTLSQSTSVTPDEQNLSRDLAWFSDITRLEDTSADAIPVGRGHDQVDGQASSLHMPNQGLTNFATFHNPPMRQSHIQHESRDSTPSLRDLHGFNPAQATQDGQGQLADHILEQKHPYNRSQSDLSSAGSSSDGHGMPYQSPSPFKVPTIPASLNLPASKRSQPPQQPVEQHVPEQTRATTPSPPKRKAPASHPQTPTPKSRRFNPNISVPPTPQFSPAPQPQASVTPVLQNHPSTQPGHTTVSLLYYTNGPLVFPQVNFSELHNLDREALTGHHGQQVASLARLAFFGNDANHPTHPRTRERQMMDMIGFLRRQREFFYVQGGIPRGENMSGGMGSGR